MKRLLNASLLLGCLFVAGVSTRAEARPPNCSDICDCEAPCGTVCWAGHNTICGSVEAFYQCADYCPSARVEVKQDAPAYSHGGSESKPRPAIRS